jgi:ergothioneine biosynthesis protein EgtB
VKAADLALTDALQHAEVERPDHPVLNRGEGVFTMLEHELLHQETLLYIWHRVPPHRKRRPDAATAMTDGRCPPARAVRVPAGRATLGVERSSIAFGWDNEFPSVTVDVPAFTIDVYDVTNQAYLEFVDAGGYRQPELWGGDAWRWRQSRGLEHPLFWERHGGRWMWRGMFDLVPLPPAWPVYVSHAEASAYARWKGGRLPSEAEFHRAAYGTPEGGERSFPWGETAPGPEHGNFGFRHWDPIPVGACPAGASAWGIEDLVGNGWEWTSTIFEGFPGFLPMASYPEYSADFFDGQHFVIKGASPATDRSLLRRSFRNWFRFNYPYMYATFRLVRDVE